MPTTEILQLPLAPGTDISDPSNAAATTAKECFTLLSEQNGNRPIWFGHQKEKPEIFNALITWDTLDSHKDFMAKDVYGPFKEKFMSLAAGAPQIVHAEFKPDDAALTKAVKAPVTELAYFIFTDSAPPAGYEEGLLKFGEAIDKANIAGHHGSTYGLTLEEVTLGDAKGKAAVLLIGWDTIEAHLAFRETQVFKDNIHLLREGIKAADMKHVSFLQYIQD